MWESAYLQHLENVLNLSQLLPFLFWDYWLLLASRRWSHSDGAMPKRRERGLDAQARARTRDLVTRRARRPPLEMRFEPIQRLEPPSAAGRQPKCSPCLRRRHR